MSPHNERYIRSGGAFARALSLERPSLTQGNVYQVLRRQFHGPWLFAHLAHLRHEPGDVVHYVFLLLLPITGSAMVVVPIVGLLVQVLLRAGDRAKLKMSIGILLGRLRDESESDDNEDPKYFDWPPKITNKLIRDLLVQAAVLAQCITSIWLFSRRYRHGSDALYDHRILQLAILGMCSSAMSIVHMLLRPLFPFRESMETLPSKTAWLRCLSPIFFFSEDQKGTQDRTRDPREQKNKAYQFPLLIFDYCSACVAFRIAQAAGLQVGGLFVFDFSATV